MKKFMLGKKLEMSQIFEEDGTVVPVTVIKATPIEVTQVKTDEKDGYKAVQVATGTTRREFRPEESEFKMGEKIDVTIFEAGDKVKIAGAVKGRGFQGVVKRHNFAGQPKTHGVKHAHRQPGSIGAVWPQRVVKGTRMAGHMGTNRVSIQGLRVVKTDKEQNLLYIRGAVPGARGTLLEITA
ncbi:MAG: 50S ribosomal protein L3 [bacterium]|nr:50S ribosomal protein L3 [bacterium]